MPWINSYRIDELYWWTILMKQYCQCSGVYCTTYGPIQAIQYLSAVIPNGSAWMDKCDSLIYEHFPNISTIQDGQFWCCHLFHMNIYIEITSWRFKASWTFLYVENTMKTCTWILLSVMHYGRVQRMCCMYKLLPNVKCIYIYRILFMHVRMKFSCAQVMFIM